MDSIYVTTLFIVLLQCFDEFKCASYDDEKRLRNDLFQNYSTAIRPVLDTNDTVRVGVGIFLISINELDEISGTFTTVTSLQIQWYDRYLIWDPSKYGGISNLPLQRSDIWAPPVYLIKPADDRNDLGSADIPYRLYNNGLVVLQTGNLLRTPCEVDVTYFPFDTQNCRIAIAAWGLMDTEVFMYPLWKEVNTSFYSPHSQWDIVSAHLEDKSKDFPVFNGILEIEYSLYYIVNILVPTGALTFMNPLVFLMPVESSDRISYTMTIFLSFAVFMTLINDIMPRSSDPMSRFSFLLMGTLAYSSIISIINIVILAFYHKQDKSKVPAWLQRILLLHKTRGGDGKKDTIEDFMTDGKPEILQSNMNGIKGSMIGDSNQNIKAFVSWKSVAKRMDIIFLTASFIFIIVESILFIFLILVN